MIKRSFTLTELLIVVLILGALAALAIPRLTGQVKASRDSACDTNITYMNRCLEIYYGETGVWPETLEDFLEDTVYFPDGPPECPGLKKYKWKTKVGEKGAFRVEVHKAKDHEL